MAAIVAATSEDVAPVTSGLARPDLVERCLAAGSQFVSDLVRALPPRAESPLRDLTLEQVDAILRIPDEGQAQRDFLRERGLAEEEGRGLLAALLRRRLITRSRRDDGAWLCLTERGRAARDRLNGLRRGLLARLLDRFAPDQTALLTGPLTGGDPAPTGFVGGTGDGRIASPPDEILNRLLHLRRGLVNWFGLPGRVEGGPYDLTLHQREALLRMPVEGVTMREFAAALGISHASATALADRLVTRGLVDREADPADRRVVRLVPTALGQQLAEHFRQAQQRAIDELLQEMDEHQLKALAQVTELLTGQRTSGAAITGPGDAA